MQSNNSKDTEDDVSKNDWDEIDKEILENLLTKLNLSKLHSEPDDRENKIGEDEQSNRLSEVLVTQEKEQLDRVKCQNEN